MTNEEINKFMEKKQPGGSPVRISFKVRKPIKGVFIKTADYNELSRKNLWRIVSETHFDSFKQSNDVNLAKIFNGSEFTKLELA